TPYCLTVDSQTLEDGSVTVRDRDTMQQERISLDASVRFLQDKLEG
ncbi:MAG: His/Gly/Thr/Pro-type tRNA ligase C-terminal domain-containing protein, partial [Bacteroidota bacterium]